MESMSCPLTPKSHSLISPRELTRMLEGLTSERDVEDLEVSRQQGTERNCHNSCKVRKHLSIFHVLQERTSVHNLVFFP